MIKKYLCSIDADAIESVALVENHEIKNVVIRSETTGWMMRDDVMRNRYIVRITMDNGAKHRLMLEREVEAIEIGQFRLERTQTGILGDGATLYLLKESEDTMITLVNGQTIEQLFTYHPPEGDDAEHYRNINAAAMAFAQVIADNTPIGEDRDDAIKLVRMARMMANAAIACRRR